ncbi:hypothetical protein [Serratia rubidaea]|uniref:hypothetical protein n=1 Tax=Serratia rubidaea TaxID=61652 RepID=UPI00177D1045|nr:hypothetical protein [Serratia rubidaea]MBD8451855.1 hypothetical protein [Serratia rubidaea]
MDKVQTDFEKWVTYFAKSIDYPYIETVLKKTDNGGYAVTWVDSAWLGWKACHQKYLTE